MLLVVSSLMFFFFAGVQQDLPEPICNKNGNICYQQFSPKPEHVIFMIGEPVHGIKIDGSVTVIFDVTEKGIVTNIKVLNSYPKGVFDRITLKMLLKNKYYPEAIQSVKARYVYTADKRWTQ